MKNRRSTLLMLIVICLTGLVLQACGHIQVDEGNLINKLFGLSKHSVTEVDDYLHQRGFKPSGSKKITYPTFSIDEQIYSSDSSKVNYYIDKVNGQNYTIGYITPSQTEYLQAVKALDSLGFVPTVSLKADSAKQSGRVLSKTTYTRPSGGGDRVVSTVKQGRHGLSYSFRVNNTIESEKMKK